jgi:hypothetical protein
MPVIKVWCLPKLSKDENQDFWTSDEPEEEYPDWP